MLTLTDISLQRGGHWLLDSASVTVQPGQRVAIVGANGAGKSSLFQLLLGRLPAEQGNVGLPGNTRIAHMAQEVASSDRTALDFVLDGDLELRRLEAELEKAEAAGDDLGMAHIHGELDLHEAWSAERRAAALLRGLGFGQGDELRPVSDFSGGWRIRLNLAQALMRPSDLLLLDEPTNHLDLEACLWLEQWLARYPGTLLFISHDRDFMDSVAGHVIHFHQTKLHLYTGNYSDFEKQRAERLAQQQAQFERQQAQIAHIQSFVDRFKAKATKAKQAQSRIKALERMEQIAPAHIDSPFNFEFPMADKVSNPLVTLRKVDAGHGDKVILREVGLSLIPGSRVGLLGPNGAGKSTLMGAIRGTSTLLAGERTTGEHLQIGYFAQHQLEHLDLKASPYLHLQRLTPKASEQSIRNFLGGFDFNGDQALGSIESFSGGEKARLALAIIAWQKPNLLLLDEPTNHLDLEMRHALVLALQAFEGAIVVVSHDRHLLRNTVDEFWLVSEGRVSDWEGDIDGYETWLAERRNEEKRAEDKSNGRASKASAPAPKAPEPVSAAPAPVETADERKNRKRIEAELRKKLSPLRQRLGELEKAVESLTGQLKALEVALADPQLYEASGKDKLRSLLGQQSELTRELESVEAQWLESGEQLEAMEKEISAG